MEREYQSIQTLRAVAAALVVFMHTLLHHHANAPNLPEPGPAMASFYHLGSFGAVGVHIFFVISGFVMLMLHDTRAASASRFMVDRITRIVPLYWLATLAWIAMLYAYNNLNLQWWEVAQSFLLLPPYMDKVVLGVGWSLNYEMLLYVALAVLVILCGLNFLSLAMFFAGILALSFLFPNYVLTFAAKPIVWEFVAGMVIWRIHRHSLALRLAPVVFAVGVALLIGTIFYRNAWLQESAELTWGIPTALIVLGAVSMEVAGTGMWLFRQRVMLQIGAASYTLYLFHSHAVFFNGYTLYHLRPQAWIGADALVIIVVAVICLASIPLHYLIERPITVSIRRLARRLTD